MPIGRTVIILAAALEVAILYQALAQVEQYNACWG